ncbi:hypothetical protein Tco_1472513, partial [Tanacetum coccineum]
VLQFYKSVCLIRNLNGTLSITFIIQNVEITLCLEEFAIILHIPCHGVCVFTPEWAITSLPNGIDVNPDIYPPPLKDPLLIRDALFDPRPPGKTRKHIRVSHPHAFSDDLYLVDHVMILLSERRVFRIIPGEKDLGSKLLLPLPPDHLS